MRQILGFKGASTEDVPVWKIHSVDETRDVGTFNLGSHVRCRRERALRVEYRQHREGVVVHDHVRAVLTGYTQTINDWYDREIDAINEPYRPIPSGAISETAVKAQIAVLLLGGLACGWQLDQWCEHDFPVIFLLTVFGSWVSYIYSAPPLKLKAEGWKGCYALGSSYIALPWWAGMATFGQLTPDVMVLTVLYSIAGLGIAIVNDFKSIEGDRC